MKPVGHPKRLHWRPWDLHRKKLYYRKKLYECELQWGAMIRARWSEKAAWCLCLQWRYQQIECHLAEKCMTWTYKLYLVGPLIHLDTWWVWSSDQAYAVPTAAKKGPLQEEWSSASWRSALWAMQPRSTHPYYCFNRWSAPDLLFCHPRVQQDCS